MKLAHVVAALELIGMTVVVGCGKPETQIVEPSDAVAPSEAEAQTQAYQDEMKKMNN